MAIDTLRDVLGAVPGATPTSTYRTPAHNAAVGGAAGSHHTRGTPDNPRAVDLVPAPGETMAQLHARVASSGVEALELLNEGDHVHVAFSGVPSSRDPGSTNRRGYTVVNRQDLAPEDTPESLAAQGYVLDPATNTYARTVGEIVGAPPEPLDTQYAERQTAREAQALDQEQADLSNAVQAGLIPEGVVNDVAKGIFQEGGQAVVSGAKRGFNAIMDLTDAAGDWIETVVPGTIAWEGFDGDASTPARIRLTTQNKAEARQEELQGAGRSMWQRLGAARIRLPTNEAERPETVTGRIIEGVTQFSTGFVGGGNVLRGWKAAGTAGRIGKNLAQGALADFSAFDGQEARLSNLLAEHAPEALAPALNWLAADQDDGELEGRFKNAIEGTVFGGAVDLLGVGVRRLRAARQVRAAAREAAAAEGLQVAPDLAADAVEEAGVKAAADVRAGLGNPEAPRFGTTARATRPEVVRVSPDENPITEFPGFRVEVPGVSQDAVVGSIRPDGTWQVHLAAIPEANRGQGVAVRSYIAAAEEAERAGARLISDTEVSPSAARVWEGLQRRGWGVEKSATAELSDRGYNAIDLFGMGPETWRTSDGSPVFRITSKPGPDFKAKIERQGSAVDGIGPDDIAGSENVFNINLARIDTPEDVQAVITGMADRLHDNVDLARRATRSWDQTREAANGVDWVQSMAERRVGGAVNAETALAYREAVNASASQVLDLARKVQAEPTLANQYAFRRATAAHSAIQNELMGARAEAGRALNAFKIPAGSPATTLRQIDSLMADAGGANAAKELADRIIDAAAKGDVALNQMIHGGVLARSRDLIKFAYTNSLLSGVGTPIINTVGNGMMLSLNLASRSISPRLAGAFGGSSVTQIGEAHALLAGYQGALRDIFKLNPVEAAQRIGANAGESLRRDGLFRGMAPGLDDAAPDGIKLRSEREEAGAIAGADRPMSAAAWRVEEDSVLGRTLDVLNMLVGAPSNINALTDDVFKTIAARGELYAQAFRKISAEGLQGEAARVRMQSLLETPDDDMLKAAEQEMHDLTFTRQTPGMAKSFSDLRRAMDDNPTPIPFGTLVFPFIKTPANLVSMGMQYAPLAPFSRRFREALAEGGAAAEQAKAKVAVGTALWSVWMGMAMDGQITGAGPGNAGQRDALNRVDENGGSVFQPYSVRFGDRWYSYERMDPLGQGLSLIGDMADLMKNADWDSAARNDIDSVSAHAIMALGGAFFDKTTLQGATEITSALLDGTQAKAEKFLQRRISGILPGSSMLRSIRRGEDPYLRETSSILDAIRNTLPGFSDELPPQRDLWGKPRTYQTGLGTIYDAIVPVQTRAGGGSAIDQEILNNGVSVTMPGRSISVMGESVSLSNRPDIYSRFLELSGQPAFEQLQAVVTGNHEDSEFYFSLDDGPSGGKAEYIKDVISAYRKDARAVVQAEYASDLQTMATERIRAREEARGQ